MAKIETAEIFPDLYHEYNGMVRALLFNICGSNDLDDLVQEVFVRIWKGLPKFNQKSQIKTWIYRIAINTAMDHLRRWGGLRQTLELKPETQGNESKEATIMAQELVQKGLAELTPIHRTVLVLACMEEFSMAEIADMTDVSSGTVKSRLHHAKRKFSEFLDENGVSL